MRWAAGIACAVALVAGCGTGAVEGQPLSESEASEPTFSPCDDIPDEAVAGLGMDPATASRDFQGVTIPGRKHCRWMSSSHFLWVESMARTLDDVRLDPGNGEFAEVAVGGRDALQYRRDIDRTGCDLAVESGGGVVVVGVSEGAMLPEDPCGDAREALLALSRWIPE